MVLAPSLFRFVLPTPIYFSLSLLYTPLRLRDWHGDSLICIPDASWNTATMPQVISYTPPWLSRPSPGATLFSSPPTKDRAPSFDDRKKSDYAGPTRTLAQRANEVFTVVDNQIRWSSLTNLKDEWKQQSRAKRDPATKGIAGDSQEKTPSQGHYRV